MLCCRSSAHTDRVQAAAMTRRPMLPRDREARMLADPPRPEHPLVCAGGHFIDCAAAWAVRLDGSNPLTRTHLCGNDELADAAHIVGVADPGKERSGSRWCAPRWRGERIAYNFQLDLRHF